LGFIEEGDVIMDINRLISSVVGQASSGVSQAANSVKQGGMPTGLVGGAAAGGLVALLMSNKKARKMGGKALKYGGLAAVGGLAYKAWSDHKASQQGVATPAPQPASSPTGNDASFNVAPPPANSAFDVSQQTDRQGDDLRLTLIRAMISSAKSDGHIDAQENAVIQQQIHSMDLAPDEKAFLFDQLSAPSDPIAIARLSNSDEQAAEIYIASALAVDPDTPEEKRYLDRLSDALLLPDDLRQQLDMQASRVVDVVA
jgi:uncharacterized membrane protein YebE (DUF533 family)